MAGERLAKLTRANARRMALRFIAASDLPGAIAAVEELRRRKLAFTIDLLGEAVLSAAEADRYQGLYLKLIEGLTGAASAWPEVPQIDRAADGAAIPRVNVSVKLSSLYSQFDPIDPEGTSRAVRILLRPILRLAKERGAFVNIDMEQYAYKDMTLRIFREVFEEPEFRDWPDVGIAIQAYLKRCGEDLAELAGWAERRGTPVWVRLVKGAYWDYEAVIAGAERLADAGVRARRRRPTRTTSADRVPDRAARGAAAGHREPQHPQHRPRPGAGRGARDPAGRRTSSRCSTAWPTPIKRALVRARATACGSTRRSASCCPGWRTSSAGCWRTRPTSPSCGRGSWKTCRRSSCS